VENDIFDAGDAQAGDMKDRGRERHGSESMKFGAGRRQPPAQSTAARPNQAQSPAESVTYYVTLFYGHGNRGRELHGVGRGLNVS
jgi:hypothetical protein